MRQLVTIRTVNNLIPIEGADFIELATVDGWQCIVKKGEFKVGDPGIYFEIDSVLPSNDSRFSFLEKRKYRVKTMKMKGHISQGLLMPLSILTEEEKGYIANHPHGMNLAELLDVQKYEPPLPIQGQQKGNFPTHLFPKTDQERIQNIPEVLNNRKFSEFEVTEKLDGTSCSIYYHREPGKGLFQVGVCSRNWEMDLETDNIYSKVFKDNKLLDKLASLDKNIAIQGEIVGPRVQGNKYHRAKQELYVFDIYDITNQRYLLPKERLELTKQLGLLHTPILNYFYTFSESPQGSPVLPINQGDSDTSLSLEAVLGAADGTSRLYEGPREGLVFKEKNGGLTFKAISNKWLLKN